MLKNKILSVCLCFVIAICCAGCTTSETYIWENYVVNESDDVLAHVSSFTIDDDNNVYIAYYASKGNNVEIPTNTDIKLYLCIKNLDNLDYCERYTICESGCSIGNITQGDRAPYDPNVLLIGEKLLIYYMAFSNDECCIKCITFDINTKIFSDELADLNLIYQGNIFSLTQNGVKNSYSLFGGNVSEVSYMQFSSQFNEYQGSYYTVLTSFSQDAFKGHLLKTEDFINFEIVHTFTELDYAFQEAALYIEDGLAYIIGRYSGGQRLYIYDMSTYEITYQLDISTVASRPFIYEYNDNIYLAYNVPNYEDHYVERATLRIAKITYKDSSLSLKTEMDIIIDSGIHYPWFVVYNDTLYMTYTTDYDDTSSFHDRGNIIFSVYTEINY